jgi:hypothetical protein
MLLAAACSGAEGPPVPSTEALAQAFQTPSGETWLVLASEPFGTRVLKAPDGAAFDLRGLRAVTITATRAKTVPAIVRLRWALVSRVGGVYVAATPVAVPPTGAVAVPLTLTPRDTDLRPAGHGRPWDEFAAAEVLALELRAECAFGTAPKPDESIELALSDAALVKSSGAPPTAVLLDAALRPPPPGWRAKAELRFRIEPPPADPFAVTGDGDVRVVLPDGKQALAFFDQEFADVPDGSGTRHVASGRPYWRAYLQELPASGTVEIVSGARRWRVTLDAADLSVTGGQRAEAGQPAQRRWEVPLELAVSEDSAWRAGLRFPSAIGKTGAWELAAQPGSALGKANAFWRPVPFWNESWTGFAGTRRPNFALAAQMDEMLSRAATAGQPRPLVALDGEMFGRQGAFNWDTHPLNGTIAGPSDLFRSPQGVDFCRRTTRYCVARWGQAQAVSAVLLTPMLCAPGASAFHKELAPSLSSWARSLGVPVLSLHPLACAPQTIREVGTFDAPQETPWRSDGRYVVAQVGVVSGGADGSQCLEVTAANPQQTSIAVQTTYKFGIVDWKAVPPDSFWAANALLLDVWVPPAAPHDLRLGVHLRDKDGLWFEALLPTMPQPGNWTTCVLDITGANANGLKAVNHKKAWNDYSRQRLTEIGLHVFSTHPNWVPPGAAKGAAPLPLSVRFDNIRAVRLPTLDPPPTAIALAEGAGATPQQVHRGDLWECHLNISKAFGNPFDPCECDLTALVTTPGGKTVRVPAFLNQACERREEQPGGDEIVEPVGNERFTLRYRVTEAGPHQVAFELREGGKYEAASSEWQPDPRFSADGKPQPAVSKKWGRGVYAQMNPEGKRLVERMRFVPGPVTATLNLGTPAFVASAELRPGKPPYRGFVRIAQDRRHFEFEDGTFYYPLGSALRSPSDVRIPYLDQKWNSTEIARIHRRGTYQYDDYLTEFQKAGMNWARVWMCSWWCGLEWRRDWPGYQGCGRYNLLNGWRMDYLLDLAERTGVFFEICVTNHGQYTLHVDTEWINNPYNATVGGPLVAPCEFFTRGDVQAWHQNRLRYVMARYAHSPQIMGWGLFSELEWTEEYEHTLQGRWQKVPPLAGTPEGFVPLQRAPNVENWHNDMSAVAKSFDPARRLITTHFARPVHGDGTLVQPGIDYASGNAYSFFEEFGAGKFDASWAVGAFWGGEPSTGFRGLGRLKKPALIGEQGRHWLGGQNTTLPQLDADLHACLWGTVVQPLAGASGYWWWLHLHFDKRYGEYKAIADYMRGEDMRPAQGEPMPEPFFLKTDSPGGVLRAHAFSSNRRMYVWVCHTDAPRGAAVPEISGGVCQLNVPVPGSPALALQPGQYTVEFWDTRAGKPMETRELAIGAGPAQLPLPAVKGDLAIKIKLKQPAPK